MTRCDGIRGGVECCLCVAFRGRQAACSCLLETGGDGFGARSDDRRFSKACRAFVEFAIGGEAGVDGTPSGERCLVGAGDFEARDVCDA